MGTGEVATWIGTGKPGTDLKPLQLAEPAGVAIAGNSMYVADTNNHRIVVIDLGTKAARELVIDGLSAPRFAIETQTAQLAPTDKTIDVDLQDLNAGDKIDFRVDFKLPEDYKLNALLPVTFRLKADGEQSLIAANQMEVKSEATTEGTAARFSIPTANKTGLVMLLVSVNYGYCRDGNGGVCKIGTANWKIPISLKEGAKGKTVTLKVTAK